MRHQPYMCPVCGYLGLNELPRSPKSGGGSYEICPSCGFQFGVTDDDRGFSYESWRNNWISRSMPWDSQGIESPPVRWNPKEQIEKLTQDSYYAEAKNLATLLSGEGLGDWSLKIMSAIEEEVTATEILMMLRWNLDDFLLARVGSEEVIGCAKQLYQKINAALT